MKCFQPGRSGLARRVLQPGPGRTVRWEGGDVSLEEENEAVGSFLVSQGEEGGKPGEFTKM